MKHISEYLKKYEGMGKEAKTKAIEKKKGKYKGAGDSKYHNKALAEQDKKINAKYWK